MQASAKKPRRLISALASIKMQEFKHKSRFKRNIFPILFSIIVSLILTFKIPILLVDFEGKVWGGEGLFSLFFGWIFFGPSLAILGVGTSIFAYFTEDKKERTKVFIIGGIIYVCFIFIVFTGMSFFFYGVLGPPLIDW